MWLCKSTSVYFPNFSRLFICKLSKFLNSFQDFPDLLRVFTSITRRMGNLTVLSVLVLILYVHRRLKTQQHRGENAHLKKSVFPFSVKYPIDRMYTNASLDLKTLWVHRL